MNSNENIAELFDLVGEWTTIPEIAETLDVKVTRVHTLITEGQLIAVRDQEGVRRVPALFMREDGVLDSLKGTLTVLKDSGFDDEETIRWLYTEDESLPGRPIDALHAGKKTEIRRRAQALAW
ncbi:Rv2175c family DNA-binding protein [Rothia sp. HC945]|uniref:Rv2175c family DNA-binding protein n=1 Tax=Rothia sp. HC945 TaxID=3171170 RepID=UPI00265413FF|nr:DNA-binding protein [Kocuria sp.]MDN5616705.1 DNA-binding protein [Kocuria sp.]MDN5654183.1 DNA-binding protein [Kocuria sp.]